MDSKELNVDRICEVGLPYSLESPYIQHRVLSNWKKTNSYLWSHWAHFVEDGGLYDYELSTQRCVAQGFIYNLPWDEIESVCKSIYANEMVKLTVQITDPFVMVIDKDVSGNFFDMLGIVGKIRLCFHHTVLMFFRQ